LGHPEVWGSAGERIFVVGVTGGIASGKTEVDQELSDLGAVVIDADQVARDVVLAGTPTHETLIREFGEVALTANGEIDRAALAGIVFESPEKLRLLNSITHPAIFHEMARRVQEYADRMKPGEPPVAVIDAALIADAGASAIFDFLLVVIADEELRVRRLIETRGMSEPEARQRIASQVQDPARVEIANKVIENNGTIDDLRFHVREIWEEISRRARDSYS